MCTVLLPPDDNPIAVNKYININITALMLDTSHLNTSDRNLVNFEHSNAVPCVVQHWAKEDFNVVLILELQNWWN